MEELIKEPTHIRDNGSQSCIDFICTDQPHLFVDSGVLRPLVLILSMTLSTDAQISKVRVRPHTRDAFGITKIVTSAKFGKNCPAQTGTLFFLNLMYRKWRLFLRKCFSVFAWRF